MAENEAVQIEGGLNLGSKVKPRQEESEAFGSSGIEDDDDTIKATTPLNGLSTAVKINQNVSLFLVQSHSRSSDQLLSSKCFKQNLNFQVFEFLGVALKTIFKGAGPKKSFAREAEGYTAASDELVQAIPSLQRKPYAEQLVGILSLLTKEDGGLNLFNVLVNKTASPDSGAGQRLDFLFNRQRPSTNQLEKANTNAGSKCTESLTKFKIMQYALNVNTNGLICSRKRFSPQTSVHSLC